MMRTLPTTDGCLEKATMMRVPLNPSVAILIMS
jgi:hypothetical protein